MEKFKETDTTTLLTQAEFTLHKIAVSRKYPELNVEAQEAVEAIQTVKQRNIRNLGRLGVKSSEDMLSDYLDKGGDDEAYIQYLFHIMDPRD